MESAVKSLLYPAMRSNLQGFSESLADESYQKKVWIEHQLPSTRDTFTDVIHFIYDDTTLAGDPQKCVGLFLWDASEVAAVRTLTSAIDALFAELGTDRPDEDYLQAPGWPRVVDSAKKLVALLNLSDKEAAAA